MKNKSVILAVVIAGVVCALSFYNRVTLGQARSDEEAYSVISIKDQAGDLIEKELTAKAGEGWTLRAATGDFLILSRRQSQPK